MSLLREKITIMSKDELPGRHSIRLKSFDYPLRGRCSQAGGYFVTIVTLGRECLFGEIISGEMRLNEVGKMIQKSWEALPVRFHGVEMDIFQVMPNHFHGIIVIPNSGATHVSFEDDMVAQTQRAGTRPAPALGNIIGAFKSITTHTYIHGVDELGWPQFYKRLWQRNYYEHIIRDQRDYERITNYIIANPANWADDEENLNRLQSPHK